MTDLDRMSTPLICCDAITIQARRPRFNGPCHEKEYLHKKVTDILFYVHMTKSYVIRFLLCILSEETLNSDGRKFHQYQTTIISTIFMTHNGKKCLPFCSS